MKYKIIFSLLFFGCLTFAQTNKVGFIYGVGYNTQVKENNKMFPVSYSYYNTVSPMLGLTYRDSIYRWLHLKVSAYYIQRGVRFDYLFNTPFYVLQSKSKFTGHYISLPIKLNAYIGKFFIGGGAEVSYLLKAHHQVSITESYPLQGIENKSVLDKWFSEPYYNAVDAGWNINFGYKIKNLEIEGSVFHGLIKPPKFDYFSNQHFEFKYAFQQTFMLCLTYYPYFKRLNKIKKYNSFYK